MIRLLQTMYSSLPYKKLPTVNKLADKKSYRLCFFLCKQSGMISLSIKTFTISYQHIKVKITDILLSQLIVHFAFVVPHTSQSYLQC